MYNGARSITTDWCRHLTLLFILWIPAVVSTQLFLSKQNGTIIGVIPDRAPNQASFQLDWQSCAHKVEVARVFIQG